MGYGEWVGNQSVHWTIVHEDETGKPVRLSAKDGRGNHPKAGHDVHIERTCRGCDPVAVDKVGERKGHGGRYRITARFEKEADAQAALARMRSVEGRNGMFEIVLEVPVIHRQDPDDAPAPEVRIDW